MREGLQMTGQPKVLLRDEDDRVIAVACSKCGRLALNVVTGLCCGCHALAVLTASGFVR
jgi:hypothetical protein